MPELRNPAQPLDLLTASHSVLPVLSPSESAAELVFLETWGVAASREPGDPSPVGALLPDETPFPNAWQRHALDLSTGTAACSAGVDNVPGKMKMTTIAFQSGGTAGIVESETMRDGKVTGRVPGGACAPREAE